MKVIAAFDFDGTLTTRDSLLEFMRYACGTRRTLLAIVRASPVLFKTILGLASRQEAKEALIEILFKGMLKQKLADIGSAFAASQLQKILRPQMVEKLHWHQQQKHICVLVSANLDIYLENWADLAGFKAALCSRLAIDEKGCVTGKLQGLNCWGPEKVRRLFEWLEGIPRNSYILYVYGDSRGDRELFAAADKIYNA